MKAKPYTFSSEEKKKLEAIQNYEIVKQRISERQQRVLELFICSDDNRIRIIGEILGISPDTASKIISDYYEGKIIFEIPNHKIYNSSLNYIQENQQWRK